MKKGKVASEALAKFWRGGLLVRLQGSSCALSHDFSQWKTGTHHRRCFGPHFSALGPASWSVHRFTDCWSEGTCSSSDSLENLGPTSAGHAGQGELSYRRVWCNGKSRSAVSAWTCEVKWSVMSQDPFWFAIHRVLQGRWVTGRHWSNIPGIHCFVSSRQCACLPGWKSDRQLQEQITSFTECTEGIV